MRSNVRIVACGALVMGLLCSCSQNKEDPVQPYSASANGAIAGQVIFGEERSYSTISRWTVGTDGSIYFFGYVNDFWSINRIDVAGNILWQRRQSLYVNDLSAFESTIGEGGYALAVASNSRKTLLNELCRGIIDIYDRTGTLIIHKPVEDPDHDIRIEGLRLVSDTPGDGIFFIAGGAQKDDTTYPFCGLFRIRSDSTLFFIKKRIFIDLPNRYFMRAAWNANESSPEYYASSSVASSECPDWQSSTGGTCWSDSVICLDDTLGFKWSCGVAPENTIQSHIRELAYNEGSIYAVGSVLLNKSDGQQWKAGLVASIAESGGLNWSKSIVLSDFSDLYSGAVIDQGTLYAAGIISNFLSPTNRVYGFALVSRFSLPAGDILGHSTLGDSSYKSGFNTIAIIGTSAVCGGFTRCYMDEYGRQGWLVNIESSMLASGFAAPPTPETMSRDEIRPSMQYEH